MANRMTKREKYEKFVGKEGFTNGLLKTPIMGKLEQTAELREGIILGYFYGGTIINLDIVKYNGKYLEEIELDIE